MVQPLVRHFWATPAWVAVLHRLGSLVLAFGLGAGSALSGVATAAAAPGATFVVDSTADAVDTHPGDGQCRTSAGSCTLRAAVQEANVHAGTDTISLPAGTYSLTIAGKDEDQGATGDLDIHDSLTITGAGAASSIVDGGGLDRVLQVFGPAAVQLSGVTIRGGFAFRGGGIYSSGELRLLSSTVTANSAGGFPSPPPDPSSCCPQNQGGGIYNDGGGVALDSVTVSNNQVNPADDDMDSAGGGLFSDSARPLTLNNVTFEGNRTSSTRFIQGGGGGGVASGGGGLVTLNGGLFAGNSTPGSGGGIAADNLTVNHARFLGNRASNSSSFSNSPGGGIAAGKLIVRDSSFVGNFGSGGGAISAGDASLTNVLVSGNSAESEVEDCGSTDGGGLRLGRGVLTNVTITGNTVSGTGGGLSIGSGSLTNVTVTNNLAGPQCGPGGPFDGGGGGGLIGSAILKNTIVAKNQHLVEPFEAGDLVEDNCRGQFTSLGHNLDSGATCELSGPGDLHNTAPKLGPLTDNGGPTLTHALLAGSPAIDAGSNTGCPAKDQRGVARPQDGNRDGVAVCDIGAFELQVPADTQAPSTSARVVPAANPGETDFSPWLGCCVQNCGVEHGAAEVENGAGTQVAPAHAGTFHSLLDEMFGGRLHGTRTDRPALLAIG